MAMQSSSTGKVDRRSTVPFLLKLFYKEKGFHRLDDFALEQAALPHVEIYSWPSCTLRELSHLLTSALPSLLPEPTTGTRIAYRLIFPDPRDLSASARAPGRYQSKELGSIVIGDENGSGVLPGEGTGLGDEHSSAAFVRSGPLSGRLAGEPEKTLQDARFVIGDFINCAIYPPGEYTDLPPSSGAGGGYRSNADGIGVRENGFGAGRIRGRGGRYGRAEPTYGRLIDQDLLRTEWRRGERIPDGPSGGSRVYGRGRGRPW